VAPAIREGAFILTNFPYGPPNRSDVPGPTPHFAYCLGFRNTDRGPLLMLAYTSSGPWRPPGHGLPLGVIQFDREAARVLNLVPFHLDLRVLAQVSETSSWLPRFDTPDHGVVAWADNALRNRIANLAIMLARRHSDVIEIRGLDR
jgi:hypothetical protein